MSQMPVTYKPTALRTGPILVGYGVGILNPKHGAEGEVEVDHRLGPYEAIEEALECVPASFVPDDKDCERCRVYEMKLDRSKVILYSWSVGDRQWVRL